MGELLIITLAERDKCGKVPGATEQTTASLKVWRGLGWAGIDLKVDQQAPI